MDEYINNYPEYMDRIPRDEGSDITTLPSRPIVLSSPEFAQQFYDSILDQHKRPEAHRGADVGLSEIKRITGGIKLGWLVYIGGPEKAGKTTMMLSFAMHLAIQNSENARKKYRIMWAGNEMSLEEMASKAFAYWADPESEITYNSFRDLTVTNNQWQEVERIRDLVSTMEMCWTSNMSNIEDVLDEATARQVDFLFVDYLQIFSAKRMRDSEGTPQEASYMSKIMKQWTLNGVKPRTIFSGVQLNREANKTKTWDSANYFKLTSSVEQDANLAFVISPYFDMTGQEVPHKRWVKIVTSRHSSKDKFVVEFSGVRSRIDNSDTVVVDVNKLGETGFGGGTGFTKDRSQKPTSVAEKKRAPDPLDDLEGF